uniref:Uncharacterized protein n=1 Tax=Chromera velia CCMP2878 TaxID=1169474 RepID=A0A0G4IE55_9ALVE|eukprot:Cvel_13563.t1-p1 / transcript=Cvel_13563.t1 / gene=Cvel_13563 / organism=Chromera_velia_CCMP2878 / gene_product=hypothetical protein / transcript_product=hypothetical protein / location=Cvel_scaffold932:14727-15032(-) / protein_length=102 / sequence_SO=supercontig / SO=protein_coding / is_pseudo=false
MSISCSKCGAFNNQGNVTGGANPCHLRTPPEDHSFTGGPAIAPPPPMTEKEWWAQVDKYYNDSYGHYYVVCNGCNSDIRGNGNTNFGAWWDNHKRTHHPYPY